MEIALNALLVRDPTVLALGEPSHAEPAFQQQRNQIFAALVDRGFRSIALETDRLAAFTIDDYVSGRAESVRTDDFSHGFGLLEGNRELIDWMRAYNESHAEPLTFHGFDTPLDITNAPSPRPYLRELCEYVAPERWNSIDALIGDDEPWDEVLDPALSIGASPEAMALRAATDDLIVALYASTPRLVAASSVSAWRRAAVCASTALGLLRYHAQIAAGGPDPLSRMAAVRDAWMAQNLLDIRVVEQHRGPTLVHTHNRHVQRHVGRMQMGGENLEWSSAGSILSSLLGERYALITGSLGASPRLRLGSPPPGTYEHALDALGSGLFGGTAVREVTSGKQARTDAPDYRYFPLDGEDLATTDAVLHVAAAPGEAPEPTATVSEAAAARAAALAARISTLPDVTALQAEYGSQAPESNWGNYFFFLGDDQYRPFATIVIRNMPGYDEESQLDRPDVVRLNLHVGRAEFERRFGFPPRELSAHRFDYTAVDELLPHPVYGNQGWMCVLNPDRTLPEVERLVALAHGNAVAREKRRTTA
ncbi:DUF6194 family protein [Cryptosporangium aurantiacum]|uniref:Erythromycin esterase homolog n=1 Tax=Cryptosporangium aurantiacum TaxID=134849 RepID=A0A1M7RDF9_9ACTN|nr:DUF6194 family protein [Cryptosporangium aurantiacum]SHN44347.1 Erythromycin esterase homolog [Cryptosporangium aurantiacum]